MISLSIISSLSYAAIASQAIAALASLLFIYKYRDSWLRWMPVFLGYTFINEVYSGLFYGLNHTLIYNIYAGISFVYYLSVFHHYISTPSFKRAIRICIVVYLLAFFINMFFQNVTTTSLLYSYSLAGCFIILSVLFYFIERLSSPDILRIKSDLLFWISTGLLLFYVGYIPIKMVRFYFSTYDARFNQLIFVHLLLVIIMNISFTLGFVWSRKR